MAAETYLLTCTSCGKVSVAVLHEPPTSMTVSRCPNCPDIPLPDFYQYTVQVHVSRTHAPVQEDPETETGEYVPDEETVLLFAASPTVHAPSLAAALPLVANALEPIWAHLSAHADIVEEGL